MCVCVYVCVHKHTCIHATTQRVGTKHMDAISTKPVFYDAGLSGIVMKEIRIEENRFSYR